MWIRVYKPQRGLKLFLRTLNVICFLITLATVIGSVVSGAAGRRRQMLCRQAQPCRCLNAPLAAMQTCAAGAHHRQLDGL